jgi:mono/diheme cytochrome c family protein
MSGSGGRVLRMAYLVACVAGVGFFALSVLLLGYWPKRVLDAQSSAMAPEAALPLSLSEQRGRHIYAREGCAYCHTQQVRYLDADHARFGAPTLAWETRFDYPHLWGTRRIGPDLSRVGGTRTDDWQFVHLYSPRAVVAQSVMPAYPQLFAGASDRPRQEARDLVAYLNSLGRARELAAPEGEARARDACNCADDEMMQMAFHGELNANPARTRRERETPAFPAGGDQSRGLKLYAEHCASCHGPTGDGDGPGAAGLLPAPANLAEHDYSRARLEQTLWNGVAGTAMPAWRDHPLSDLAALAVAVRTLHAPSPETPAALAEQGAQAYAQHCVQCHGERGDGRGTAADALAIAPADFTQQRPTLARSIDVLRRGIAGTPMVPWTSRLSEAEVVAVAQFVRTFYAGENGAGRP